MEEIRLFVECREQDLDALDPYVTSFEYEDWPHYKQFKSAIDKCQTFINKYQKLDNFGMSCGGRTTGERYL